MTKTVAGNTTQYFYDEQGHLTGEYDASGQLIQEIIWLGDLPVAVLRPATNPTATPEIYYIHADHLGTPRKITRPNDNRVVWSWESEAFGNSLPDQNPAGLGTFVFNLRFPGQYYDQESGLFYNYSRDYDPATGRYIESDPIGLAGGINTYIYVGVNPVNWVDSNGLEICAAVGQRIVCTDGMRPPPEGTPTNGPMSPAGAAATVAEAAFAACPIGRGVGVAGDFFAGTKYTQKVLSQMKQGNLHGFPESVKAFQEFGQVSKIRGGDGATRELLKIQGEYHGFQGAFEFIKEADGSINHRFFRPIRRQ